jgi:hypothetical protein
VIDNHEFEDGIPEGIQPGLAPDGFHFRVRGYLVQHRLPGQGTDEQFPAFKPLAEKVFLDGTAFLFSEIFPLVFINPESL